MGKGSRERRLRRFHARVVQLSKERGEDPPTKRQTRRELRARSTSGRRGASPSAIAPRPEAPPSSEAQRKRREDKLRRRGEAKKRAIARREAREERDRRLREAGARMSAEARKIWRDWRRAS
jgi:hypothetical protein